MAVTKLLVFGTGVGRLVFDEDGGGGWATHHTDTGPLVQLRFAERPDGRIGIAEVHVVGAEHVDGTDLRSIPLGRIEATVNRPGADRSVREHVHRSGPTYVPSAFAPTELADVFDTKAVERRPSLRLKIPSSTRKPDNFYARVAELYTWLAGPGGSRRPAVDIADANGTPVTTVHRWVKEARARGLLVGGERPVFSSPFLPRSKTGGDDQ
jgi:hypothetical protein